MRYHDDVIKWKHFPRYWTFVQGIHRSPVNSPHNGQWRGALMFSLICAWIKGWVNNRKTSDFRRHRAHYDVVVMLCYGRPCFNGTCLLWSYRPVGYMYVLIHSDICDSTHHKRTKEFNRVQLWYDCWRHRWITNCFLGITVYEYGIRRQTRNNYNDTNLHWLKRISWQLDGIC